MLLSIRSINWRRLAARNDPLDTDALSQWHIRENLIVAVSGNVMEKVHQRAKPPSPAGSAATNEDLKMKYAGLWHPSPLLALAVTAGVRRRAHVAGPSVLPAVAPKPLGANHPDHSILRIRDISTITVSIPSPAISGTGRNRG